MDLGLLKKKKKKSFGPAGFPSPTGKMGLHSADNGEKGLFHRVPFMGSENGISLINLAWRELPPGTAGASRPVAVTVATASLVTAGVSPLFISVAVSCCSASLQSAVSTRSSCSSEPSK